MTPLESSQALLAGAAQILSSTGSLALYGPFFVDADDHPASNVAFHERLQSRNPLLGVRSIDDLRGAALDVGLELDVVQPMPSNNHLLVFRKLLSSKHPHTG